MKIYQFLLLIILLNKGCTKAQINNPELQKMRDEDQAVRMDETTD